MMVFHLKPKSPTLLTCSARVTAALLGCTTREIFEKEQAGLLTHVAFWLDHELGRTHGFLKTLLANHDVRHYHIDDVMALLPEHSDAAADLRQLDRQNAQVLAGQIELTSWRMPYIAVTVSHSGKVTRHEVACRAPCRPKTLPPMRMISAGRRRGRQ